MPLQKPVRGLNDLLGLYTGGNVPLDFSGLVQAQLDFLPFLAPPEWRFRSITDALTIGTGMALDPVPTNEKHIVWRLGLRMTSTVAAGEAYSFDGLHVINAGANQAGLNIGTHSSLGTSWPGGSLPVQGIEFAQGLHIGPGEQLGWIVTQRTGATARTVQVSYQFSRIRI